MIREVGETGHGSTARSLWFVTRRVVAVDHFGLKEGLGGARNRGTNTSIKSGIGIVAGDTHAQINGFSPLRERGGLIPALGFAAEEKREGE